MKSPAAIANSGQAARDRAPNLYAELVRLAAETAAAHTYLSRALATIARGLASPYAALHVRFASEVLEDECHSGPDDPAFWRPSVQQHLNDTLADGRARLKLLSARTADLKVALLGAPLLDTRGAVIGAVALLCRADERSAPQRLALLESLAGFASFTAESLGTRARPEVGGPTGAPVTALARAAHYQSETELAYALVNQLRAKFNCEQVSLGRVQRRRVQVLAISGLDDVKPRSPAVRAMQAAMEECLDHGQPIVCQRAEGWNAAGPPTQHRLHEQWHQETRGAVVASLPLGLGGDVVAIVSLRRRADDALRRERLDEIARAVVPYGGMLVLLREAKRGVMAHAAAALRARLSAVLTPGRRGAKLAGLAAALLVAWVGFGTVPYEVHAPAVVAPASARQIAMPYDGVLAQAAVVAGDRVRRGDALCQLDLTDLLLQRDQLDAELTVLEHDRRRAAANGAPVEAQLAQARQRLLETRRALLERRITQGTLRAPFDGVIVTGDLRKRIGAVLAQGTPLLELAPLTGWTLEIAVAEQSAGQVQADQLGQFASHARPEAPQPVAVTRVRPQLELRQNRNVYVVEANFEAAPDWLRPGMEGVVRVSVGPRPVWWVGFHRVIDYLRLNLWL